jgi:hypothetical protein
MNEHHTRLALPTDAESACAAICRRLAKPYMAILADTRANRTCGQAVVDAVRAVWTYPNIRRQPAGRA